MPYLDYNTDEYSQLAEQIVYSEGAQLDPNADNIEGEALLPRYILSLERDGGVITLRWKTNATKVPEGLIFEVQVGIREDGPWYAPVTAHEGNNYKWRSDEEGTYRVASSDATSHSIVPSDITLYYRIRPATKEGLKGQYSNIVVTTSTGSDIDPDDITSPDPDAPELIGYGANGNNYLEWNRQDNLLHYSHAEVQVADSIDGPWYAPDIVGGDTTWRGFHSNEHTEAAGFLFVHPSVPNILLYYRIRIVTTKIHEVTRQPIKSSYSNIVSIRSEVEVEAPTLTAVGSIGDVILNWNKQENLLHEKYIEIQVAENENGPWYAPYTIGDGKNWRVDLLDGVHRVSGTTTFTHTNIPIAGTQDDPQLRTLWYRVRRVDSGDNESVWSNIVMANAGKVNLKFIDGVVQEAQLDATVFDALRTLSDESLGYWSLDDTLSEQDLIDIGELKDTSTFENHLKVTSDTVADGEGIVGNALSFSGVTASIVKTDTGIGDTESWGKFSQCYWIKPLATQLFNNVIAVSYFIESPRLEFYVILDTRTNQQRVIVRSGSTEYSLQTASGTNLFDDVWHFIAVSYDGESKKVSLWIDGVQKIDTELVDGSGIVSVLTGITQSGNLSVGGGYIAGAASNNLNGLVDEVRLYSIYFTTAQIRYLWFIPEGPVAEIVDTSRLVELAITETKIADDAISTPKIKANAVQANQIDALAILTKHLSANAVTSNTIAAGAVLASHILAEQILARHIQSNAIESDHIDSKAIIARHLSAGLIDVDKLTAEAIEVLTELEDGSVTSVKIKDGAVIADKIAAEAIDVSDKISSDTIRARHLTADSINLEGTAIFGILRARHIDSDVINAATLRTSRISLGSEGGGTYRTLASEIGTTYDAFLVAFSMGGLVSTVVASTTTRHYILAWDSARATEVVMGVSSEGNLRARNEREHEEFFSPDILEVFCEYVIGLKWPNATQIGGGTTPGPTPGIPSNLHTTETISGSSWKVNLDFDSTGDTDTYQIEYTIGDGAAQVVAVSNANGYDITVPANTAYSFSVRAIRSGVIGDWSSPYSDSVGAAIVATKLSPPSGLGSQETQGTTNFSVNLSWGTVQNTSGYEAEYQIGAGAVQTRSTTSRSFRITVPPNTSYRFRVKAVGNGTTYSDSDFSGWYSDSVGSIITVTRLTTPSGLGSSETPGASTWTVVFTWGSVANADNYSVEYDFGGSSRTVTASGTSLRFTGIASNTGFRFRVKANGSGSYSDSPYSGYHSDSTGSIGSAPAAPSSVSISVGARPGFPSSSIATINYPCVLGATSYVLERKITAADGTTISDWSGTRTRTECGTDIMTFSTSTNTANYMRVRVKARNAHGESGWRNSARARVTR